MVCVLQKTYKRNHHSYILKGGAVDLLIEYITVITNALITLVNISVLGLTLKLYTEYFKDRSIAKRKEEE